MQSLTKRYGTWWLLATLLLSPAMYADTAHVAEDAHIDLGNPQDGNGGVPNLMVSNIVDKKGGERLTFVSYDLPALPDGFAGLGAALGSVTLGRWRVDSDSAFGSAGGSAAGSPVVAATGSGTAAGSASWAMAAAGVSTRADNSRMACRTANSAVPLPGPRRVDGNI